MNRAGIALTALLLLAGGWSVCEGQTPEELFDLGNEAYREGRFVEAAEAYGGAAMYGIRDPRLEYNLGNASFRLGMLGEAILHYERAYQLDPTDADTIANLELARSLTVDLVEAPEIPALLKSVRSVQDGIGPDIQAVILLILYWMVAGLAAWCWSRPSGWNVVSGWAIALLLCLALVVSGSWRATHNRLQNRNLAVVLDESVEVLSGPGENNAPLVTIHEGLAVKIRSERESWVQISLPDGLSGWVPREKVGFV